MAVMYIRKCAHYASANETKSKILIDMMSFSTNEIFPTKQEKQHNKCHGYMNMNSGLCITQYTIIGTNTRTIPSKNIKSRHTTDGKTKS